MGKSKGKNNIQLDRIHMKNQQLTSNLNLTLRLVTPT